MKENNIIYDLLIDAHLDDLNYLNMKRLIKNFIDNLNNGYMKDYHFAYLCGYLNSLYMNEIVHMNIYKKMNYYIEKLYLSKK